MAYKHGAYGMIQTVSAKAADTANNAIVYVGTAPVQTIDGGAANVNRPILVNNIAEARAYFGYSEDFEHYTLCEAMHVHFDMNGVGPLVLINVLDPNEHIGSSRSTQSKTPANGIITLTGAESFVLDSIKVLTTDEEPEELVKGEDYTASYDLTRKTITIREVTAGSLGTDALTISYNVIDFDEITESAIIGTTDNLGLNTGIYAIANVYQETGYIPSFLLVPGWSDKPNVHNAMYANSQKINGHWDAYMFVDLPLSNGGTAFTLNTIATWKESNGYTHDNETVYFPMAKGTDNVNYHLSVLAAANFQSQLFVTEGIPYKTASNTPCPIIRNLYLGEDVTARVYDDTLINNTLNKNGIASACYTGGQWVIWGRHTADYNQSTQNMLNSSETNRMMLYYVSNDFQSRRVHNIDKPLTQNDISSIISEEQSRLDALVKIGALIYGQCYIDAQSIHDSDMYTGDYYFSFDITTMPLSKSMTAVISWTEDGFATFFEAFIA